MQCVCVCVCVGGVSVGVCDVWEGAGDEIAIVLTRVRT